MSAVATARSLRWGPWSRRVAPRSVLALAVLALVAVGTVVLALTVGRGGLAPTSLLYALTPDASGADRLVFEWRGARALAAVLFGACLGVSGAVFQAVTRNPLGSPDVIGLNAGSYAGVVAVIALGGTGLTATAAGSLAGGLAAACAVYLLAFKQGVQGFRLIIVGIAVGAVLQSLTSWFSVRADLDVALRAAIWGAGTLSGTTWHDVGVAALAAVPLALSWPWIARVLPQLALGDDAASAMGLRLEPARAALVVLGVASTALVTAFAGPIAFVALAAPQIARRIVGGGSGAPGVLGSALVGAVLLGLGDVIAQHALPARLPVGAVTVVIGGMYLVWLLFRESGRS
ncbi:iron chelate uptake ABC transporter family permease subunit [Nocardioides zeae]|uniref:Iron chelate uptake ABC transporter family permease subunit n=1 Tax=Nocardioides imazamoxiresistens TaxID=3231893 RepID=A0ABU3PQM5_9ACTN|nr:iron chelate uptake ABC transporter family permease subunit [Nocardioides zeae]MDT9591528.1 iron chelate uptake ABC transporter family permease subunit [Nocardioides zeae]